jgi:FkbM family methyltransferase
MVMTYYSQHRQDEYLFKNFFYDTYDGVFVDVGAHDGVDLNNTLFFENTLNWKGISIEPIPSVFEKLKVNRPKSITLNYAISDVESDETPFLVGIGYTEMLSGLLKSYDPRHLHRMEHENQLHGSKKEIISVKTKRLDTIFDEYNVTHIHYLSVDTEGAELDTIKSIDFNKVFIDIINFENNYGDTGESVVAYLLQKGYEVFKYGQEVFMIHSQSKYKEKYRGIENILSC